MCKPGNSDSVSGGKRKSRKAASIACSWTSSASGLARLQASDAPAQFAAAGEGDEAGAFGLELGGQTRKLQFGFRATVEIEFDAFPGDAQQLLFGFGRDHFRPTLPTEGRFSA